MTTFRLYAGTNIGMRDNNEDNFTVCRDLTLNDWVLPADQQVIIELGNRGCLAVVADGMGGQNAGEVASATAIETVQNLFAPNVMPANVVEKRDRIISYLKKVIVQADLRIKQRSANDSSVEGMGSTIVIAWLIGGDVYVGWIGDSRAYSFIPNKGITRITKDHSYVQQLVDAKLLTEEQAMNDPNSNVIMRSLGDASQKAKPDVVCHPVTGGEIILLCTDGLCGVCTDKEIEEILHQESDDIYVCKERLTQTALDLEGSDNITIALLQIVEVKKTENPISSDSSIKKSLIIKILIFVSAVLLIHVIYLIGLRNSKLNDVKQLVDSIGVSQSVDTIPSGSLGDTTSKITIRSKQEVISIVKGAAKSIDNENVESAAPQEITESLEETKIIKEIQDSLIK